MLSEKITKNIKKFRELKGYTREDMASFMEMSASGYAKIEQAKVDISVRRLEQVATILEVKIRQLMEFEAHQVFNPKGPRFAYHDLDKSKESEEKEHAFQNEFLKKLVDSLERENKLLRERLEVKEPKA